MIERLKHWIFKARKKKCWHCCLRCEYWDLCKEDVEQQWQEYIELHRGELVSELMRSAHQEMVGEQYKTEVLGAAVTEFSAKLKQEGISVQDIDGQEERTWQDKIMDRFMRRI